VAAVLVAAVGREVVELAGEVVEVEHVRGDARRGEDRGWRAEEGLGHPAPIALVILSAAKDLAPA